MLTNNNYDKWMEEMQTNYLCTSYPKTYTVTLGGNKPKKYIPKQVIFNPPATIVIWEDGTKTIVKRYNEDFDFEKGFAMAYLKKVFGGRNQYIKYIKNAKFQSDNDVK